MRFPLHSESFDLDKANKRKFTKIYERRVKREQKGQEGSVLDHCLFKSRNILKLQYLYLRFMNFHNILSLNGPFETLFGWDGNLSGNLQVPLGKQEQGKFLIRLIEREKRKIERERDRGRNIFKEREIKSEKQREGKRDGKERQRE